MGSRRRRQWTRRAGALAILACTAALAPNPAAAAGSGPTGPVSVRGTHPGGATYAIEVPRHWNGTVLTFSPGYGQGAGTEGRPAELGGNPAARTWLLDNGYALAGTRPFGDGWAVEETLRAVPQTMAAFRRIAGEPEVTLAWGASMGGAVTAGLAESRPDVVDGALPYCASVAGPVAMLNQSLDAAFAFRTLLAPGEPSVRLTGFASAAEETRTTTTARRILDSAQRTAEGRARIALAAAFAQVSTWSVPGTAEPSRHDWAGQQAQQYAAFMPTVFSPRYPLEQRAGGNFSRGTPASTTPSSCDTRGGFVRYAHCTSTPDWISTPTCGGWTGHPGSRRAGSPSPTWNATSPPPDGWAFRCSPCTSGATTIRPSRRHVPTPMRSSEPVTGGCSGRPSSTGRDTAPTPRPNSSPRC